MTQADASAELKGALRIYQEIPRFHVPEHSLTARAHQKIQQTWYDLKPKDPTNFDLKEIHRRVAAQWASTHSLDRLRIRDRKWIPWILFYPAGQEQEWLGYNEKFSATYSAWLRNGARASAIVSLIRVLLLHYAPNHSGFRRWLATAREILGRSKSPRVAGWAERCNRFCLLQRDGPEQFAKLMLDAGGNFTQIEEQAGLERDLAQSEFLGCVCDEILKRLYFDLKTSRSEISLLPKILPFFEFKGNGLRFENRRKNIADFLLLPFASGDPPTERVKDALKGFFLRCYGDPRIHPWRLWEQADERARGVMNRWFVTATLEDFFRVIGKAALESHWQYREAFWRAYLGAGVIDEAWVILGERVSRGAMSMLRGAGGGYAQLIGGIQKEQSVLIIKIANLIFSEWSHNGTCRAWIVNDRKAPEMYKQQYKRSDLVSAPRFSQVHRGSENGRWQENLAEFIREHTGIRMSKPSYMP